ncbi:organic cation transporter protein-like [Babylonia areolata]|uniref:organic cation transporter protein-like n=1 Tax=Babylonia areolata TaxID=304850 RepID=UPI003FD1494A
MATTWDSAALGRVEVDEVWKAVGRYGRYQVVQILTLSMAGMSMAYPVLSIVFEGGANPHKCRPSTSFLAEYGIGELNGSVVQESCKVRAIANDSEGSSFITTTCDGYDYQQPEYLSFVSEWGLVCNKAALTQLSQTVVMAGMFAGATVLSNLADRFGRKRAHVGCHVTLLALSLAMAFMPNYVSFVATKFFIGVFQQGYMIPLVIHLLEILPTEQRAFMGVFGSVLWAFSLMSMAPIAFVMKTYSWRDTQLVFGAMHAVCFLEFFVLDESLRWLVANHRFQDIRHVICKASKYNHRDPDVVFATALERSDALRMTASSLQTADVNHLLLTVISEEPEEEVEEATSETPGAEQEGNKRVEEQQSQTAQLEETSGQEEARQEGEEPEPEQEREPEATMRVRSEGILDIIKDPDMRFLTLIMLYIWMTNSLTYYGITLLSSSLAGNPYLNFFLGGLIEIPSNVVMWMGLSRFGRKKTVIVFISLAGISLLMASIVAAVSGDSAATGVAQTTLSMVARFGITGSFNAIWVYTPELFPTNLRNVGVGIASSSARIGGMAAPFFKLLSDVAIWAPGVIFSVACLLVTFLLTLLPETRHRSLPQSIVDVKRWRREGNKGN